MATHSTPLNWTRIQSIATLEASRRFRFRPEERPALLSYLGIAADSKVIEVGCGTGILANFLAAGIPNGFAVGIDITPEFLSFAKAHRSLSNVSFVAGDAYAIPVSDGAVDACTSYTLLAVLRDPAVALSEQIRVTRKGGVVSAIEVIRSNIAFGGHHRNKLPATDAQRLSSLREKWARVTADDVEPLERRDMGYGWAGAVEELPLLFESVGLKEVRLRGFFSTFSTSDETYPKGERRWFLQQIGKNELAWVEQQWTEWQEVYVAHGFSNADIAELRHLIAEEQALRLCDFDEGHHIWAWHGITNLIVAGTV